MHNGFISTTSINQELGATIPEGVLDDFLSVHNYLEGKSE